MKLSQLRRHWDRFARTDPYWAVLTEPDKQHSRWALDEFFATGVATIDAELARVRARHPGLRPGRALDFGCGVGRLTQALARHFDAVVGVDLSGEMIALARRHIAAGARVEFVHNLRPDLRVFPDARFDFVCSLLTLQHLEPRHARFYIAEFLRVCAPGGAVLFQLPTRTKPRDPPERLDFSFWPPTLWMRTRRYVRYHAARAFPRGPVMEMHALPQDEVLALLRALGAEVLDVWPDAATDPAIGSNSYLARKS